MTVGPAPNDQAQSSIDADLESAAALFRADDDAGARIGFEKVAEQGSASAMAWLGYLYLFGHGVAVDKAEARRWYRKAAEAGDAEGQHFLASILDEAGEREEAEMWIRKAAVQGFPNAVNWISYNEAYKQIKDRHFHEAVPALMRTAKAGSAWAQEILGWMYWTASGVLRDYHEALRHYEAAYSAGRKAVAKNIGRLHLKVGQPELALEWLRKDTQNPISSLFWQYAIITRHPQLAAYPEERYGLLKRAAAAGHAYAKRDMVFLMMKGHKQLGTRLEGLRAWFALLPYVLHLVLNDPDDERLR